MDKKKKANSYNPFVQYANEFVNECLCEERLRGCLSYFHPVNFASEIILPEALLTERLYLGKN